MKRIVVVLVMFCAGGMLFLAKAQEVKINTGFVVEADGTIRSDGNATVWDDINVFPDATTRGSLTPPTWSQFLTDGAASQGVYLYFFNASSENELFFTVQIPHAYKVGTDLFPHVHWTTLTGTPNSTNSRVTWALEYSVISIGGTFANTTTNLGSTIIGTITPVGTGQHLITSLGTISGTGLGISSIIVCRFYRDADSATDDFPNTAGLLGFDIHYQQDTQGSRQEFIK